jgi:hypothetical protein
MSDRDFKQGDSLTLAVICSFNDGTIQDLTGAGVTFSMWRATSRGTPIIDDAAAIVTGTPSAGGVLYDGTPANTASVGVFQAEFHVTTSAGKKVSFPSDGYLTITVEQRVD